MKGKKKEHEFEAICDDEGNEIEARCIYCNITAKEYYHNRETGSASSDGGLLKTESESRPDDTQVSDDIPCGKPLGWRVGQQMNYCRKEKLCYACNIREEAKKQAYAEVFKELDKLILSDGFGTYNLNDLEVFRKFKKRFGKGVKE